MRRANAACGCRSPREVTFISEKMSDAAESSIILREPWKDECPRCGVAISLESSKDENREVPNPHAVPDISSVSDGIKRCPCRVRFGTAYRVVRSGTDCVAVESTHRDGTPVALLSIN